MRVELTLTIDVPMAETMSDAELRDALEGGIVKYAATKHLEDGHRWKTSNGAYESAGDVEMMRTAAEQIEAHGMWSDICTSAQISRVERREAARREGAPTNDR